MYCNHCGKMIGEHAARCPFCGGQVAVAVVRRKLERPREGRKLAGVCLGIANYFNMDVVLIRILWLAALCFPIPVVGSVASYIIAWVAMPEESTRAAELDRAVPTANPS